MWIITVQFLAREYSVCVCVCVVCVCVCALCVCVVCVCVCASLVLLWHAIPSFLPSAIIAWGLEGRDIYIACQISMGACICVVYLIWSG